MAAPVRLELTTHLLETWSRCSSLPPSLPVSAVFAAPVFAATGSHSRYEAVNSRMRLSKHKLFCLCLAQITKKEDRPFGLSSFLAPPVWLEQTTCCQMVASLAVRIVILPLAPLLFAPFSRHRRRSQTSPRGTAGVV